jgi:general stress protein YciG
MISTRPKSKIRGFAGMTPERRREIASMGGKAAQSEGGLGHKFTSEEARIAGRKGGAAVARNREHMSEIGKKGAAGKIQAERAVREIRVSGGVPAGFDPYKPDGVIVRESDLKLEKKGGADE